MNKVYIFSLLALFASIMTVGAYSIVNEVYAQEEPISEIQENINLIIGVVVAITGLVGTVATLIVNAMRMKRDVLGIKHERDEDIIKIADSVGRSDEWTLENESRLRTGLLGVLTMAQPLNKLVTENRSNLKLTEEEAKKINDGIKLVNEALPSQEEINKAQKEINAAARNPQAIG